jgi:hypothetical protein
MNVRHQNRDPRSSEKKQAKKIKALHKGILSANYRKPKIKKKF